MACSGPNKDFAYAQGEIAYQEIARLLREKHRIEEPSFPLLKEDYIKDQEKLKTAIQELFWTRDCAEF